MLMLLSPAKSLNFESPVSSAFPHTLPAFPTQTRELVDAMRGFAPHELASLMHISDALASLNAGRFADFRARPGAAQARQALLAFNGDVYEGLQAKSLDQAALEWAQDHLAILSGLYGVLRPLDRMQAYRLEMGTRLTTEHGSNLYAFWGDRIARHLDKHLQTHDGEPVLVNLASQEYFKSVNRKVLEARVVECVFEDWHGGTWKIISFHAKRARGSMARFAIDQRAACVEVLQDFRTDGYAFAKAASSADRLVFRRCV